ncbi:unnamed protein product [Somion occarium]|uniref:NAD-dependent epimerase/dehydratase domain-containing protein n=1 Tax=Somion occarium TaxID=3059160 RepID=A0ABP1D0J2_9APHY
MPAVQPPSIVLVTGASGFSGAWIVRAFLDAGYSVHGTVRSLAKAQYLNNLFKSYDDRFKAVIIEDTSKLGAFDKVVNDEVSAVVHVAGVAHFAPSVDQAAIFGPNTDSVVDLLQTLLKYGTNVKRFIYMSSAQAMLGKPLTHIYTEDDWNDNAVAEAKEKGSQADGQVLYAASKVLAERAIIDFTEKHKGQIGWDATRIVPVWMFGPIIHDCNSVDNLNLSAKIFYQFLTTEREKDKDRGSRWRTVHFGCRGIHVSESF